MRKNTNRADNANTNKFYDNTLGMEVCDITNRDAEKNVSAPDDDGKAVTEVLKGKPAAKQDEKNTRRWVVPAVAIFVILAFLSVGIVLFLGKKDKSSENTEDTTGTSPSLAVVDVKTDTKKPGKAATKTTKKTTEANAKNGVSKRNGNADGLTNHAPTEAVTETPIEKPTETPTETPTTETTKPTEKPTETTTETTTEKPTETTTETTTEKPTETTTETTTEATTECNHNFVAQYKTEKVEVEPAWKEYVEEDRCFCSYCEKDITGNHDHIYTCGEKVWDNDFGEWLWTGASIIIKPVVVDTIYHDAIYENQKVLTGYKCSKCGKWK